jgi:hypothetical protein
MPLFRRCVTGIGLSVVLMSPVPGWSQEPAKNAEAIVQVVKYTGLAEEVAKHKGKVVVVDFWFTT